MTFRTFRTLIEYIAKRKNPPASTMRWHVTPVSLSPSKMHQKPDLKNHRCDIHRALWHLYTGHWPAGPWTSSPDVWAAGKGES